MGVGQRSVRVLKGVKQLFFDRNQLSALVYIAVAAPKFKSESNRSAAVIGGMLLFIFCFLQIRGLYRMKNRWYGSAF